jgi:hypothetical protein
MSNLQQTPSPIKDYKTAAELSHRCSDTTNTPIFECVEHLFSSYLPLQKDIELTKLSNCNVRRFGRPKTLFWLCICQVKKITRSHEFTLLQAPYLSVCRLQEYRAVPPYKHFVQPPHLEGMAETTSQRLLLSYANPVVEINSQGGGMSSTTILKGTLSSFAPTAA